MLGLAQAQEKWDAMLPPQSQEFCICGILLEDCENGFGCIRCVECNRIEGECLPDCGQDHLEGCAFPQAPCRCKKIAADFIAERQISESKEGPRWI